VGEAEILVADTGYARGVSAPVPARAAAQASILSIMLSARRGVQRHYGTSSMKTGEPIMSPNRRASRANDLILIAPVKSFHDPREPPLILGNKVRLNSGGPEMLVVEIDEDNVTVGYNKLGQACEYTIHAVCVHRIKECCGDSSRPR
jgi:hypothetical protein